MGIHTKERARRKDRERREVIDATVEELVAMVVANNAKEDNTMSTPSANDGVFKGKKSKTKSEQEETPIHYTEVGCLNIIKTLRETHPEKYRRNKNGFWSRVLPVTFVDDDGESVEKRKIYANYVPEPISNGFSMFFIVSCNVLLPYVTLVDDINPCRALIIPVKEVNGEIHILGDTAMCHITNWIQGIQLPAHYFLTPKEFMRMRRHGREHLRLQFCEHVWVLKPSEWFKFKRKLTAEASASAAPPKKKAKKHYNPISAGEDTLQLYHWRLGRIHMPDWEKDGWMVVSPPVNGVSWHRKER